MLTRYTHGPMTEEDKNRRDGEERWGGKPADAPASNDAPLPAVGGDGGLIVVSPEEVLAAFTIFITWRVKRLEKSVLSRTAASVMISRSAPEFTLAALNGNAVSLADYRGKKTVVVSYWASWCGPCKVELPELREFYQRYHKADANFEILAISIDEQKADAEKYAEAEKLPFPVLFDPQSKTADAYSVEGIPTMFVIDKSGKIVHAHVGLEQAMQIQLMGELGLKYAGMEDAGETK